VSALGFWSRWRMVRRLGRYARGSGGSPPPDLLRRLQADIPERLPLAGPVAPSPRPSERARPPRRLPVAVLAAVLAAMVTAGLTMTLQVWDLLPPFRTARSAQRERPGAMPGPPPRSTADERVAAGPAGSPPAVALPSREAAGAAPGGAQTTSQAVAPPPAPGLAKKTVAGAPGLGGARGASPSPAAPREPAPALQGASADERSAPFQPRAAAPAPEGGVSNLAQAAAPVQEGGASSLRRAAARGAARNAATATPGATAETGAPAGSGPPAPAAGEAPPPVAAVPFAPAAEGPGARRQVNIGGADSAEGVYIRPAPAPAPPAPPGSSASEKAARAVPAPAAPVRAPAPPAADMAAARQPAPPAAGLAATMPPPHSAPAARAMPLHASFGGDAGTAGYGRVRQALLAQGRLPRPDAVPPPEQLTGAFEVAAAYPAAGTAGRSTLGLSMEGAPLPGPGPERRYLLRIAVQGLPGPPRRDAVAVDFDPAVVARIQRVGATAGRGAATALFEVEMQPAAGPAGDAVVVAVRLPGAAVPGAGGGRAEPPGMRDLRLSGLRRAWGDGSAALRIPGLAFQLARALTAEHPAAALQALRGQAEALAAELPGDPRTAELLLLVRRAADLAAVRPAGAPLRPAAPPSDGMAAGEPPPPLPPPPPSDRRR
jgi:hypothetical protein